MFPRKKFFFVNGNSKNTKTRCAEKKKITRNEEMRFALKINYFHNYFDEQQK